MLVLRARIGAAKFLVPSTLSQRRHIDKAAMVTAADAYSQRDLEIFGKRIDLIKQEIEFERKIFGHAFPLGDSRRVGYLLDGLRVLHKQRAELLRLI